MPVLSSELQILKSATVTDTSANGGRLSTVLSASGVTNNLWPNVMLAERTAGSTKYRKVFAKNANDDDLTLSGSRLWLDKITPGDDWVVFFAGTQIDTQADIVGTEAKYGCGALQANVAAAGTTLIVDVEDNTLKSGNNAIFRAGGLIRITDKLLPTSVTGAEEFLTIDTVTPDATLPRVTITTTSGLLNPYTVAAGSRVMSVYEAGDVVATVGAAVATSVGTGDYDDTLNPIAGDNIATVQQAWTLTFTDATNYTLTGDTLGSVASGTTASDFAPSNPDYTKPYFTLAAAGWSGVWAAGDTLTFTTVPAAVPVWESRIVPAGAASLSGDSTTLVFTGESA